ncbi:MAG TPA: PAS domain S-box protein, partial [Bdellovibrionales bacterium]|nr:PAS domain S-box protein [Bdellovibrionales bacterium]
MSEQGTELIFQRVMQQTSVGFAHCDLSGTYQYVNDGLCRILGVTSDNLIGTSFLDRVEESDRGNMRQMQTLFKSGRSDAFKGDVRFENASGRHALVSLEATLIRCPKTNDPVSITFIAYDITGRSRNEELLRISERRLHSIHQSEAIGVHYFDTSGIIHEPNDAYLRMTGFNRRDFTERAIDWRMTSTEEWRDQDLQVLAQLKESGQALTYMKEILGKSGKPIPVCITAMLLDPEDQYHGIALIYDMSELFDARQEAEEYRHKANLALDASRIGVWDFDPVNNELMWDARCRTMFDLRADEKDRLEAATSRLSISEIRRLRRIMKETMTSQRTASVEFRVQTRRGTRILAATGKTFRPNRSVPPRLVGTLIDVTETKLAEQRIFESEERFRTLAETIPQIVFIVDSQGDISYLNRRWYEYTGQDEALMTSPNTLFESIHDEDRVLFEGEWSQSLSTGKPFDFEYRIRSASGDYRWFVMRALPLVDGSGNVERWFGSCTDIHGQKLLADQLLAAKEAAERADHMKSSFLANMSHEIRTPLGAILGFAELLNDEKDLISGEREEFLKIITRNGQSLSRIVDDILDLSKVEAGVLTLEEVPISPERVVVETIELFSEKAAKKKVGLRCDISKDTPSVVVSDAIRIRQIVGNLISNAIKFTEHGEISVSVSANSEMLIVRVEDSGIGIEPHQV